MTKTEVAVIGSGPGGALTAALLSEAGVTTTLIEEGPFIGPEQIEHLSVAEMEQKYRNGGITAMIGKNKIAYVEARCVGGGSEVNSGLYHRTPPDILARWRSEFQVADCDEASMRPFFESCEKDLSVAVHPGSANQASLRLKLGAERLGWHVVEVPRWYTFDGISAGVGTRQTMTRTYIARAASGTLLHDTEVRRLRRSGKKWLLSAEQQKPNRVSTTIEAEHVFVCCGAVQTPLLLRSSGIKRNIGNSLQVHPTVKIVARFSTPVNNRVATVPVHQIKEFSPVLSIGGSVSSRPFLSVALADYPSVVRGLHDTWESMTVFYAAITPKSVGVVRNMPGFRDGRICYELLQEDYENLAQGVARLCELSFAAGAEEVYPSMRGGRPTCSESTRFAASQMVDANVMTIHLFSSVPMGEARQCAVDSFGRLRDVPGVTVSDASILCTAPSVNPQGSVVAFARRNVQKFLESRSR